MTASSLRERIVIESRSTGPDGMGGETETWAALDTVWADVKPVRGRENEDAGRLASIETYLVTIRHRTDVTTINRIQWRDRVLNIRSVQDRKGDRHWLTLECEAGAG